MLLVIALPNCCLVWGLGRAPLLGLLRAEVPFDVGAHDDLAEGTIDTVSIR
ncbi:MAG: hypothetical protein OEM32_10665 [Acidimicrobiia bacterium]|nr:hypothetical protein [Acidimicrobiia bacterium]